MLREDSYQRLSSDGRSLIRSFDGSDHSHHSLLCFTYGLSGLV